MCRVLVTINTFIIDIILSYQINNENKKKKRTEAKLLAFNDEYMI